MDTSKVENAPTIGKYLRRKKKLTLNDSTFVREDMPAKRKSFLETLLPKGLKLNKVSVGVFKMKNGLEYSGVYATEDIKPGDIIMNIPSSLHITARNAWFSSLRTIYQENSEYFNPSTPNKLFKALEPIFERSPNYFSIMRFNLWEFRMNFVFYLHEYSKGKESEYFEVIENLPRDFDTAAFWDDTTLNLLEDQSLIRYAKLVRENFEDEAKALVEIVKKYPTVFKIEYFTYENMKWVYLFLCTRQYYSPLKYQTYAPIGEFFNHELIGVHELVYNDSQTDDISPQDEAAEELGAFQNAEEQLNDDDDKTSDDTDNSVELDELSDFEFDEPIQKGDSLILNEEKKEQQTSEGKDLFSTDASLNSKVNQLYSFITNSLNWGDHVTVFYLNEILTFLQNLHVSFTAGKMTSTEVNKHLADIEVQLNAFSKEVFNYYKEALLITNEKSLKPEQFETLKSSVESKPLSPEKILREDENWEEAKMNLGLKTTSHYQKESQVYLFYGRTSNRFLLVNYGATIEYNKYDNVHFKIPYFKYLSDCWLLEKIKSFKMSKVKKFKARRRKFSIELATFFKAINWRHEAHSLDELFYPKNLKLELKALGLMKELYQDFLKSCKNSEDELANLLKDPKLGYREYFATILNLERQRCIRFHLKALLVLTEILNRLVEGVSIEKATQRVPELETAEEYKRNRNFLGNYIERFPKNIF